MRIIVTGSSGYLGSNLVKTLRTQHHDVVGIDVLESNETSVVGSITDKYLMEKVLSGADTIIHSAALHKLHLHTHSTQQFIDVNIIGTQNLLEAAVKHKVKSFIYTSSTSTFGHALYPGNQKPAVWVNENLRPIPKNIYGVTKIAAENLCQLAHQESGLSCIILKTSRFFAEENDMKNIIPGYSWENIKAIEYLYRRAHISDIVTAHILAIRCASEIGFDKFIITATTPFTESDCADLILDAPAVLEKYYPSYKQYFDKMGWRMFTNLTRVYDNKKAREHLGWCPKYNFSEACR
ncbi:MAG TPA: NAD(P)-dependent oxidoreductase [Aquella sp.]|nr:NAD(P)-dependent oxidoreductase [Aquella sp.]